MLKFDKNLPVKDTHAYLAKFPRFSLIEKITPRCFQTEAEGSLAIANIIKEEILRKNALGHICVLGLATGSSPLRVYRELIRFHKSGELSFKNVVTFNLDEYYPIKASDSNSYHSYMHDNLFRHIDIPLENINIPNGEI
jgi:glucosamine-6-phosphate deaminase